MAKDVDSKTNLPFTIDLNETTTKNATVTFTFGTNGTVEAAIKK